MSVEFEDENNFVHPGLEYTVSNSEDSNKPSLFGFFEKFGIGSDMTKKILIIFMILSFLISFYIFAVQFFNLSFGAGNSSYEDDLKELKRDPLYYNMTTDEQLEFERSLRESYEK